MAITSAALASQVQVNIPFSYLLRGYLERFLELGLNPEIGLDAYSLAAIPPGSSARRPGPFRPRQAHHAARPLPGPAAGIAG